MSERGHPREERCAAAVGEAKLKRKRENQRRGRRWDWRIEGRG